MKNFDFTKVGYIMPAVATAVGFLPAPTDADDGALPGVTVVRRRDRQGRSWRFAFITAPPRRPCGVAGGGLLGVAA